MIATGYLANTKRFGSYEEERYPWYLTYEDQIDNLGRTFLGLTISCARCHDHKFDPISQADYYALYGFFSSTRYPRPGSELDKVQRDFVPLSPADQIAAFTRERDAKLPEIIADVEDAFAWRRKDGPRLLRIDPTRLVIADGSAGGCLTLTLGARRKENPTAESLARPTLRLHPAHIRTRTARPRRDTMGRGDGYRRASIRGERTHVR